MRGAADRVGQAARACRIDRGQFPRLDAQGLTRADEPLRRRVGVEEAALGIDQQHRGTRAINRRRQAIRAVVDIGELATEPHRPDQMGMEARRCRDLRIFEASLAVRTPDADRGEVIAAQPQSEDDAPFGTDRSEEVVVIFRRFQRCTIEPFFVAQDQRRPAGDIADGIVDDLKGIDPVIIAEIIVQHPLVVVEHDRGSGAGRDVQLGDRARIAAGNIAQRREHMLP